MSEIKDIFEEAIKQTWKGFCGSILFNKELIKKAKGSTYDCKGLNLALYENDVVVKIAHHIYDNMNFSDRYVLFCENIVFETYEEDIVIVDKDKVDIELDNDLIPIRSSKKLKPPVELVAEVKLRFRNGEKKIRNIIENEMDRLNKIKEKGIAKEVYLVIFSYYHKDLRYLEKEYPQINLRIFPLNLNVLLKK